MHHETYALTLHLDPEGGRSWGCARLEDDGWRALDAAALDPFVAHAPCRIGVAVAAQPKAGPVELGALELSPLEGGRALTLAPAAGKTGEPAWGRGFRAAGGRGHLQELGIYDCDVKGDHRVRVTLAIGQDGRQMARPVPVMGPP